MQQGENRHEKSPETYRTEGTNLVEQPLELLLISSGKRPFKKPNSAMGTVRRSTENGEEVPFGGPLPYPVFGGESVFLNNRFASLSSSIFVGTVRDPARKGDQLPHDMERCLKEVVFSTTELFLCNAVTVPVDKPGSSRRKFIVPDIDHHRL